MKGDDQLMRWVWQQHSMMVEVGVRTQREELPFIKGSLCAQNCPKPLNTLSHLSHTTALQSRYYISHFRYEDTKA